MPNHALVNSHTSQLCQVPTSINGNGKLTHGISLPRNGKKQSSFDVKRPRGRHQVNESCRNYSVISNRVWLFSDTRPASIIQDLPAVAFPAAAWDLTPDSGVSR